MEQCSLHDEKHEWKLVIEDNINS